MRVVVFGILSLASIAALAWIATRTGATMGDIARHLPLHVHLLAAGTFLLDYACRGLRLSWLADGLGDRLSLAGALRAQFGGQAAGAVTPARTGTEPAKILLLSTEGMAMGTVGAVMVGEMIAEVLVLVAVAAGISLLLPGARVVALAALAYAGVVTLTMVLSLSLARLPEDRDAPRILASLGLTEDRWENLQETAIDFRGRAAELRHLPARVTTGVLGLSLVHVLARLAVLPILAGTGAAAMVWGPLLAWPLLLLYGGALIPSPGGGGVVELGFAAGLDSVLPAGDLAGTLVWWRVYTHYLGALVGGGVLLLQSVRGFHHAREEPAVEGPA